MSRKIWVLLLIAVFLPSAVGATVINLSAKPLNATAEAGAKVLDNGDKRLVFEIQVPKIYLDPIKNDQGRFTAIRMPGFGVTGQIGAPSLPAFTTFVRLPAQGAPTAGIVVLETHTIDMVKWGYADDLMPVQPPAPKCLDCPAPVFAQNKNIYQADRFVGDFDVKTGDIAVIRGVRMLPVSITPVRYNPARSELEVATRIRVQIDFGASFSAAGDIAHPVYRQPVFNALMKDIFINAPVVDSKSTVPTVEAGAGYLIITAPAYSDHALLNDFADWKTQKGFTTVLVDTNDTGVGTANIQAYITDAYNTWDAPPAYVLLVGDVDTIENFTGDGSDTPATDLYYAAIDGADYFPDLFVSRISVADGTHLDNALTKILDFEQATWTGGDDWVKTATFMASNDHSNVSEATHDYCSSTYLDPDGYDVRKRYSTTYSATTQEVIDDLNEGVSMLIYSGHGSIDGWSDGPALDQTQVNALTNTYSPFVASHACLTGQFTDDECFMETWLRSPTGAVTNWGSSVNSYWPEDDILQKRYFDGWWTLGHTTIGAFTVYGMLELFTHYGGGGPGSEVLRYFEMYNVLGDASLDIWTDPPEAITPSHLGILYFGSLFYNVTVPGKEGVLCAVAHDGTLYGAAYTDAGGLANIVFDAPISVGGAYTVTCTGHNIEPSVDQVLATASSSDGIIIIDHEYYGDNYTVLITVSDADLIGGLTLEVFASSDTETVEEPITLTEVGTDTGAFSGTIVTEASSTFAADGKLQIQHDDTISIRYHDADNGTAPQDKFATALADLQGPIFAGIAATDEGDGWATLEWATGADINGPITYSIYMAQISGAQDFTTPYDTTGSLSFRAEGLTNGSDYYFVVRATDGLQNQETNLVEFLAQPTEPTRFWQETWGTPGNWDHPWTIEDDLSDGYTWGDTNSCMRDSAQMIDNFIIVDSDCDGSVEMDEELISEVIDVSNYRDVQLRFSHYLYYSGNEKAEVDAKFDGGDWENLATYSAEKEEISVIDLSDRQFSTIQIRFHYYEANFDWYWLIDDIELWGWPLSPGDDDDDDDSDDDDDDDDDDSDDDDTVSDDDDTGYQGGGDDDVGTRSAEDTGGGGCGC